MRDNHVFGWSLADFLGFGAGAESEGRRDPGKIAGGVAKKTKTKTKIR